ncbi:HU family DNA-binding protein [Neotabrizicola sp. sgz301269]|uniref:HU family DNA-binding protein n=1 Tax=Neotabrizicola sp. sgz301269 TaxID=3276282 RepID=UPI0037706A3B
MATKKSSAAKASAEADPAASPEAAQANPPAVAEKGPGLKIKDLVTRVTEATGGKRKDVKEMVEATLKVLGDAMAKGEDMNLPGFGRTRITRTTEKDGAAHLTMKVRRGAHRAKHVHEPLAEDGEDS